MMFPLYILYRSIIHLAFQIISHLQLKRMICNACGKKLAVKQGIVLEGVISVDHTWDYFSEKDGQTDHFDLCEECYDQMTAAFKIAVETEEQTEYL